MPSKIPRTDPLGNVIPYRNAVNNPAPPPEEPPASTEMPTIVGTASGAYNSGNSKIEIPISGLGITNGDLLVLFPARVASNSTLVPGGSWTERSYDHVGAASSIEGWSTGYWTKVANNETSPLQIDTAIGGSAAGNPAATLLVVRNFSTSAPIHVSSKTALISNDTLNPTLHPIPQLSTTVANCLLAALAYNNSQSASGVTYGSTPTEVASVVLWYDGSNSLDGSITGLDIQNGDLMVLCAIRPGSSATISPGGGWTQHEYDTVGPNTSEGWKIGLWTKTANNEANPIVIPTAAGGSGSYPSGIIKVYRNANTTTPIHVKAKTTSIASGTSHALPSITTTKPNCMVLGFNVNNYSSYVEQGATIPSGYANETEQINNYCSLVAFSKSATATGEQTGTVTWAQANDGSAYHLAIGPTETAGGGEQSVTVSTGYTIRQQVNVPGVNLALATRPAVAVGNYSGAFTWGNGDEGTVYHLAIGPSGSAPPPPTTTIPDEIGSMLAWYDAASQTIRANPSGTGMVNGDLMVLFAVSLASDSSINPSGWTPIEYDSVTGLSSSGYRIGCWWKVANNEPNPITVPITLGSSGAYPTGIIKIVRGANNTNPISAKQKSINLASSTSHALPGLTTIETNTLLLAFNLNNSATYLTQGATAPSGYLLESEILSASANLAGYSKDAATAQAYTGTVTWAVAGPGSAYHLSIKPGSGGAPPPPPLPGSYYPKTYTEDTTTEFGNPRQGIIRDRNSNNQLADMFNLSSFAKNLWDDNQRILKYDLGLQSYRNSPIPQSYLDAFEDMLIEAEAQGFTLVLRAMYSYDIGQPDTDLPRMFQHVNQFAPYLNGTYGRAVHKWDGGFIGAWGEEHSTPLSTVPNIVSLFNHQYSQYGQKVWVTVRRLETLQAIISGAANSATAFDTRAPGHHNHFIFGNANDAGTYTGTAAQQLAQRELLKAQSVWFPMGGEMHYTDQSPYVTAQQFMDAHHEYNYNYMRHFWSPSITKYNTLTMPSGITLMQEVRRRMGARIFLQQAKIPQTLTRGQTASFEFTFINRGTANITNPRGFELILRNQSGGAITRLPFHNPTQGGNRPEDPRRWISTHTITPSVVIPAGQATGTYDVKLFFPDGLGSPSSDPRHAFRLACTSMWESGTGYNDLQQAVTVA